MVPMVQCNFHCTNTDASFWFHGHLPALMFLTVYGMVVSFISPLNLTSDKREIETVGSVSHRRHERFLKTLVASGQYILLTKY